MDATDFDAAVPEDDVLSLIFKFIPPADLGSSVLWVNKRWHRVVKYGALHAPLQPGLITILHSDLETGRLVRWKLHMALCFRNLLRDPHFAVNPKMYPADPFRECPWVWTKIGSLQTLFEVKPEGIDDIPPEPRLPWGPINTELQPRYPSTSFKWGEVTQVVDLVAAFAARGIPRDAALKILESSPLIGFGVYVGARWDSEATFVVQIALDDGKRALPFYQTPLNDAFSRHASFVHRSPRLLPERNRWRRYSCVLEGYDPGVRRAIVSLRGKGVTQSDKHGPKFASPELVLLPTSDGAQWVKEDREWWSLQLDSLNTLNSQRQNMPNI